MPIALEVLEATCCYPSAQCKAGCPNEQVNGACSISPTSMLQSRKYYTFGSIVWLGSGPTSGRSASGAVELSFRAEVPICKTMVVGLRKCRAPRLGTLERHGVVVGY